jgi:hypothetical protein
LHSTLNGALRDRTFGPRNPDLSFSFNNVDQASKGASMLRGARFRNAGAPCKVEMPNAVPK